jgi:hypothetical protein
MIAIQPDLRKVFKPAVIGNVLWIQMAMVIDDGHSGCVLMVQGPGRLCLQQKILIQEFFHGNIGLTDFGFFGKN